MIPVTDDKRMLGYELLSSHPDILHFVTTRHGGTSEDAYGTFNCSPFCGDNPFSVTANQKLLCADLGISLDALVFPRQVHGKGVLVIDENFTHADEAGKARLLDGVDALVTCLPGYCLCISTADCVPVLLYDKVNHAIGAVHAGWRGTVDNILLHTLSEMKRLSGTDGKSLYAVIGPGISKDAFEVGDEVYERFCSEGFPMNKISFRNKESGKYHIDLWEANKLQLMDFGIPQENIQVAGICTYTRHENFYSARRLGISSGRLVSGIMFIK